MNKRILITGGASGLGKALAALYVKRGERVLITDINAERGAETLKELGALGELHFQLADTTKDEDWQSLREWVETNWGGLDILVNNAGVASAGLIDHLTIEDWDWIIEINLKGVIRGCHAFVPMMKRQGSGNIVNIASLAAIANLPSMNSYNVTKAGVFSLSETMRGELSPYGIKTTVVCPGFVPTNLGESLRSPQGELAGMAKKMIARGTMNADQVAQRIARAVDKGQFLELPNHEAKLLHVFKRALPSVYHFMVDTGSARLKARLERSR